MTMQKRAKQPYVCRPRISKAKYDTAMARITALEAAVGAHWYVVGKSAMEPCGKCGLLIADSVHKDNGGGQHAAL